MTSELAPANQLRGPEQFERAWLKEHLATERRSADLLSEIREAVFGAQDGLTTTLAVVGAVGGATGSTFAVLVAGMATALAGVFSMAAGEYLSSKSQREIFDAQIRGEEKEIADRPAEALAEVAFLLQEEGLSRESALRVARELSTSKAVLLKTMIEKELGLASGDGFPLRGAAVMGASFGLASLVVILPYTLFSVTTALYFSLSVSAIALFAMGVVKSRWTRRHWLPSGLEVLAVGAFAGVAGYFFGTLLPALLGVAGFSA